MKRLAIISSHPIQYNAPFFIKLNDHHNICVKVFYTWGQSKEGVYDPGFDKKRTWDIPLLDGYEFEFIKNIALKPGSHHFLGIININLKRKIKEWEPDVIIIYGWAFFSHLLIIKQFYNRIPIFFRGDSTLLREKKNLRALLRRMFLKWVYKSINIGLYVGKYNYDYYLKHGVSKDKLKFMPHTVDNERFISANIEQHDKSLNSLQSKISDKFTFLFVGKFEKNKNPMLLLNAFINLANNETALIFIGEGELEQSLKLKSEKYQNIFFASFQNQKNLPGFYKLGQVLVLPSYHETWGLVINEGMAAGLVPIISDKVGCSPDLVENEVNGYVFKSNNLISLVEAMKKITDLSKLKEFKEKSIEKISHFTIDNNVSRMVSLINEYKPH